ncbi:ATP-binding protein [Planctomycetota bacterium]
MSPTLEHTLDIPTQTVSLSSIRENVRRIVNRSSFDDRMKNLLVLAIDEAVTSILGEKRENSQQGGLTLELSLNNVCFKATVKDSMVDYQEIEQNNGEFEKGIARSRHYKLGVFLMRKIMDEVQYSYTRGFKNELTLLKFLPV